MGRVWTCVASESGLQQYRQSSPSSHLVIFTVFFRLMCLINAVVRQLGTQKLCPV
jgi:hypothetical protein